MVAALFHRFVRKPLQAVLNLTRREARRRSKQAAKGWKIAREKRRNGVRYAYVVAVGVWRRALTIRKPFVRASRRTQRAGEIFAARRREWDVEREIRRVVRTRATLVLGPWLSEVGFETLYWVPFTRWVAAEFGLDPTRVVALSRGGVESWYRPIAARYVEMFDHLDPQALGARIEARRLEGDGSRKQFGLSDLDRDLIAYAVDQAGIGEYSVLHPSLMYRLFRRFWLGQQPVTWVQSFTRPALLTTPSHPSLAGLPDDYIAVKFYAAASMPDTTGTRAAMRALVDTASRIAPVVLLDTGMIADDHDDYRFDEHQRVFSIRQRMQPSTNLEVQTAVIAKARCFIGTCGSIAWLAPMLGVPTVAVMSDDKFLHPHLYFARQAYRIAGAAPFMTVDVRALQTLDFASVVNSAAAAGRT